MANRFTRGHGLFGAISVGGGTRIKQFKFYSANVSPAKSSVSANVTEERTYTTGFTGVLTTDSIIQFAPKTALASSLAVGSTRISASGTIAVLWANPSASASSGLADFYQVITARI